MIYLVSNSSEEGTVERNEKNGEKKKILSFFFCSLIYTLFHTYTIPYRGATVAAYEKKNKKKTVM